MNRLSHNLSMQPSQLPFPKGAQPRVWHTATAMSLEPGWTQVTMFGGCLKWERGKSADALPKLAKSTVLEFGKHNTQIVTFSLPWLFVVSCPGPPPRGEGLVTFGWFLELHWKFTTCCMHSRELITKSCSKNVLCHCTEVISQEILVLHIICNVIGRGKILPRK